MEKSKLIIEIGTMFMALFMLLVKEPIAAAIFWCAVPMWMFVLYNKELELK